MRGEIVSQKVWAPGVADFHGPKPLASFDVKDALGFGLSRDDVTAQRANIMFIVRINLNLRRQTAPRLKYF